MLSGRVFINFGLLLTLPQASKPTSLSDVHDTNRTMSNGLLAQLLPSSLGSIPFTVLLLLILLQLATYAYNLFLHPLRKFPGPITSAISNIPFIVNGLKGTGVFWAVDLHQKYGEVVRIAPNELSFSGNEAYKDIYGHKKAGQPTLEKDPQFYMSPSGVCHAGEGASASQQALTVCIGT